MTVTPLTGWPCTACPYRLQAGSRAEDPTFCPLHGEQHFTDVLWVVTGALDGPVQSLPAVLGVAVCPRAESKQAATRAEAEGTRGGRGSFSQVRATGPAAPAPAPST